jgi:hypothetical protein
MRGYEPTTGYAEPSDYTRRLDRAIADGLRRDREELAALRAQVVAMREAVRVAGNAHLETLPHQCFEWAAAEEMHGVCLAAIDALSARQGDADAASGKE